MSKTVYKTRPRLFILSLTLLGFIFGGLLFWLTFSSSHGNISSEVFILLVFFAIISIASLFYFFSIKTIKLTSDGIIVSYLLLPFRRNYSFKDIVNISQTNSKKYALVGPATWRQSYIYTDHKTIIKLRDKTELKLNSIGQLDFDVFYKNYLKMKQGEGKTPKEKVNFLLYLIDNIDGILWVVLLLACSVGLSYGLLTRQ